MIIDKIKLSQTALKELEKPGSCHYLWQKIWIDKEVKIESTLPMKQGSYLEYLSIGAGSGHSEAVTDLPRKQGGAKTVDQIRIEEQAEAFKKNIEAMGFTILKETIQMKLEVDDFVGIIDFMAVDKDGEISIWDLKGCGDIYSDFGFTNWSRPTTVDFTQQYSYCRAWFKLTEQIIPCYLYVADHSPAKNVKVLKLNFNTDIRFSEIEGRLKVGYEYIEAFVEAKVDMPHNPSNKNCNNCPLRETCKYKLDYPQPELVELD